VKPMAFRHEHTRTLISSIDAKSQQRLCRDCISTADDGIAATLPLICNKTPL